MPESGSPPARLVHSVLASAVSDPDLLDAWRRDPAGFADFDFSAIWRFSGLVTKVRHNDLRASLPATFKILDSSGISIELFASYAPRAADLRREGQNSKAAKIAALVEFLDSWLDRTQAVNRIIWDVVRHESAIFHLRVIAASEPNGAGDLDSREIPAESCPIRSPGAAAYEMNCDPVAAARAVLAGADLPPAGERVLFAYCLTKDRAGTNVMAIDELASYLLDAADGSRTVLDMAEQLRMSGIPLEAGDLMEPIANLAASGLLQITELAPCA